MKFFAIFLALLFVKPVHSQNNGSSDNLRHSLLQNFYADYKAPEKRKILSLKNKHLITKLNPLTYISAGLLFFYQRIVSEQIQANCMYQTSCSNFTKFEIEKNGFRGFLLGINQLDNCFQGIEYDYQPRSSNLWAFNIFCQLIQLFP